MESIFYSGGIRLESIESFLDNLYATKVRRGEEDGIIRMPFKSQGFRVNSYYKALSNRGNANFPWEALWQVKAFPHVAFFFPDSRKG